MKTTSTTSTAKARTTAKSANNELKTHKKASVYGNTLALNTIVKKSASSLGGAIKVVTALVSSSDIEKMSSKEFSQFIAQGDLNDKMLARTNQAKLAKGLKLLELAKKSTKQGKAVYFTLLDAEKPSNNKEKGMVRVFRQSTNKDGQQTGKYPVFYVLQGLNYVLANEDKFQDVLQFIK